MKIFKTVLYVLFALMFINAGLNKFLNYMPMPELTPEQIKFFTAFTSITWLMPLVAAVEIIGGLLFLIPRTRALGAIVILPVMVGVIIHHAIIDQSGIIIALVLMAINILAIMDYRSKYEPMIRD
ncbi:DoxX family protein [Daejeonella sp.]|uniref:DoxX family protein n=1 Tax=Daejeonella sp. TaxID=2805397 RepID=UPI0039838B54